MRRAHTVAQVRAAEAALMATLPPGTLMRRAATGLAHAVIDFLGGCYGRRVILLVGSGDNGGDALHAGAFLARRGAQVTAWLLSDRVHQGGLAALRGAGGRHLEWRGEPPARGDVDVVVDGIVGIGGHPGLRPAAVAALEALSGIPVVAVDVPSGVGVDTGELAGPSVVADLTVTFGTHKICHLADPAAQVAGAVQVVDIGLDLPAAEVEALQPDDVAALLPAPGPHAQKYTRGVVGVRAGSDAYPGAALLAVAGAATGLAGMVRYVGTAADRVKEHFPEVVGAGRVQAWVVGPGGGEAAGDQLAEAVADGVPVVVDASALPFVRESAERAAARRAGGALWEGTSAPRDRTFGASAERSASRPNVRLGAEHGVSEPEMVLTPHAGELAALLQVERVEVEATPLAQARRAAARFGQVVLLKGRHTVIATPQGRARINTTGTPWLATAGAGDVLAGLIGALLAAGLEPFDAASVGAWLHGAAASLAAEDGPIGARDVARAVPAVIRGLRG